MLQTDRAPGGRSSRSICSREICAGRAELSVNLLAGNLRRPGGALGPSATEGPRSGSGTRSFWFQNDRVETTAIPLPDLGPSVAEGPRYDKKYEHDLKLRAVNCAKISVIFVFLFISRSLCYRGTEIRWW